MSSCYAPSLAKFTPTLHSHAPLSVVRVIAVTPTDLWVALVGRPPLGPPLLASKRGYPQTLFVLPGGVIVVHPSTSFPGGILSLFPSLSCAWLINDGTVFRTLLHQRDCPIRENDTMPSEMRAPCCVALRRCALLVNQCMEVARRMKLLSAKVVRWLSGSFGPSGGDRKQERYDIYPGK